MNNYQKQQIKDAIKKVELNSDAELLAVISQNSKGYLLIKVLLTAVLTSIIYFFLLKYINNIFFFLLNIFIVYKAIDSNISLFIKFLPNEYKKKVANKFINKYFFNVLKNNKNIDTLVLFYVSIDEKYVEIVTNKNISNKIDNKIWKEIIDSFLNKIKNDRIYDGYIEAINSSKQVLIKKFPKKNNKNELKNDLIEL